jgi:RecA-family ATPase
MQEIERAKLIKLREDILSQRTGLEKKYDLTSRELRRKLPTIPIDWLVEGLFVANGINLVTGKAGDGKSMFLLHIAYMLEAGLPVFDLATPRPRKVLMVDGEMGAARLEWRTHQFEAGYEALGVKIPDVMLYQHAVSGEKRLDLTNQDDADHLTEMVGQTETDVVMIDPLCCVMTGNPSSPEVMQQVFDNLARLRARTEASIILTIHQRKGSGNDDPAQSYIGSFRTGAEVATILALTKFSENVKCEQAKNRDGCLLPYFNFTISQVEDGIAVQKVDYVHKPKTEIKAEAVEECIFAVLESGEKSRTEIAAVLKEKVDLGRDSAFIVLRTLADAGKLVETTGHRGSLIYSLPPGDETAVQPELQEAA